MDRFGSYRRGHSQRKAGNGHIDRRNHTHLHSNTDLPIFSINRQIMTNASEFPEHHDPSPLRLWGLWSALVGALALGIVFFQIFAPPADPQPSVGQQIGEIAGEMKRSAWRSFLGLEPEAPEPRPEPSVVSQYLPFAGPALGIIAILLSLVSAVRREHWRMPTYGAALGASAILFQFFWWVALLVAGVVLLVAIIENLGDFFSFW